METFVCACCGLQQEGGELSNDFPDEDQCEIVCNTCYDKIISRHEPDREPVIFKISMN